VHLKPQEEQGVLVMVGMGLQELSNSVELDPRHSEVLVEAAVDTTVAVVVRLLFPTRFGVAVVVVRSQEISPTHQVRMEVHT